MNKQEPGTMLVPHTQNEAITINVTEAFQSVIETQVKRRNAKTPQRRQSKVDKGNKGSFKYVKGINAMKWLEENFVVTQYIEHNDQIHTIGDWMSAPVTLTVVDANGISRTVTRNGSVIAVAKDGKLMISPVKSVFQDALKRCCVALGGFRDVYGEQDAEDDTNLPLDDLDRFNELVMPKLIQEWENKESTTEQFRSLLNKYFQREITLERILSYYQ